MLARRYHIPKTDFDTIFSRGRWYRGSLFTAKIIQDKDQPLPRFSCVVAKKNLASAVDRHILKRRTYHVIQKILPTISSTTQAIFFFQDRKLPKIADIEKEITSLLQQSKSL